MSSDRIPFIGTMLFNINRWAPLVIYGVACLLGVILTKLIPIETAGRKLMDFHEQPVTTESHAEELAVPLQDVVEHTEE